MHQAYMFLYTPDQDKDLRATANMVAFEYADQHCDSNNWYEVMGIIAGDGKNVIEPKFADYFQQTHGETLPDVTQCGRKLKNVGRGSSKLSYSGHILPLCFRGCNNF